MPTIKNKTKVNKNKQYLMLRNSQIFLCPLLTYLRSQFRDRFLAKFFHINPVWDKFSHLFSTMYIYIYMFSSLQKIPQAVQRIPIDSDTNCPTVNILPHLPLNHPFSFSLYALVIINLFQNHLTASCRHYASSLLSTAEYSSLNKDIPVQNHNTMLQDRKPTLIQRYHPLHRPQPYLPFVSTMFLFTFYGQDLTEHMLHLVIVFLHPSPSRNYSFVSPCHVLSSFRIWVFNSKG